MERGVGLCNVAETRGRDSITSALSRLALVCALVALPLCFWLYVVELVQFSSSDRVYQAVTLGAHEHLSRTLDHAMAASIVLAVVGVALGAVAARRATRRGASSGIARRAIDVGLVAAAAFATAFAAAFMAVVPLFIAGEVTGIVTFAVVSIVAVLVVVLLLRHLHRRSAHIPPSHEPVSCAAST